jgi:hypothetical protein
VPKSGLSAELLAVANGHATLAVADHGVGFEPSFLGAHGFGLREVVASCLARIGEVNPTLNAVVQLRAGDALAEARGCKRVWLDSYTFQAPTCYQRLGYELFGSLQDYPAPHGRVFLTMTF